MIYPLLLLAVEVLLFITNYKPGTYLLGWDNVMPEFDLWLNLNRSLTGVWQDYRGLGLLDGMAHTANLLHILYIWILSSIFPQSMLRYIFIFLAHLAGGLSMFYLLKYLFKERKIAFLGALFYMFNIGIIQMFFAPLEVFAIHFATLPILTLLTLKAVKQPSRKNLLLLMLAGLLTSPQGFVPTVFIVFMILFGLILLFQALSKKEFKTAFLVFAVFMSTQLFWLLPYVYSIKYNAPVIQNSKINQFSSEEIFYRNKSFGGPINVLGLKGFMMDTVEYNNINHTNEFFLKAWRDHAQNLFYKLLYSVILGLVFFGLYRILKDKRKELYPYLLAAFIAFFFLANNTLPFEQLNNFIRSYFPLVGEVFRFPFTKFITLLVFCFSIIFAYGISWIFSRFSLYKKHILIISSLVILYLVYPAFQGHFISPLLKVKVPKEYFALMSYLNKQDEDKRISMLPANTFWNWQYRSWGQRGSGFLWYGIKQPMLERSFDPWSNYNEQFYNEFSYAQTTEDLKLFERVLDKYDVSYLLLDEYIINNVSSKPINYDRIKRFLRKANFLEKEIVFGKLALYRNKEKQESAYHIQSNIPVVFQRKPFYAKKVQQSLDFENFINNKQADVIYPFDSLFTEKLVDNLHYDSSQNDHGISIKTSLSPSQNGDYQLEVPSLFESESLIPVQFEVKSGKIIVKPLSLKIKINNETLILEDHEIVLEPQIVKNPTLITLTDTAHDIKPGGMSYIRNNFINVLKLRDRSREELLVLNTRNAPKDKFIIPLKNHKDIENIEIEISKIKSPFSRENLIEDHDYELKTTDKETTPFKIKGAYTKASIDNKGVYLEAKGESTGLGVWQEALLHEGSYIVFADYNWISGLPISFSIDNPFEKRPEVEARLSKKAKSAFLIIPASQEFFKGYGLSFTVKSLGTEIARARIAKIAVHPLPLETLTKIRLINDSFKKKSNDNYLVLSQSYHPGWIALEIRNSKLEIRKLPHVMVNNWANAWELNSLTREPVNPITILFWPQYLEYLGFGLLIIAFIVILLKFRPFRRSAS